VPEALTLVLPDYRYSATAADGVMENEVCPVVRARSTGLLQPDSAEVAEAGWYEWEKCEVLAKEADASPWFRDQMTRLTRLGPPRDWPSADPALLAPAITW
jgi:isopentenyl-diphosphate delta-isomerase